MGLFGSDSSSSPDRDAKFVVVDNEAKKGDNVHVKIPTISRAKVIEQSGWDIGEFIGRTKSSGKVVEKPHIMYCTLFLVREDEIVLGLTNYDKLEGHSWPLSTYRSNRTPDRRLYLKFGDIKGIHFKEGEYGEYPRSIRTNKDEFRFGEFDIQESAIEFIKTKQDEGAKRKQTEQDSSSQSVAEELKQLNQLHENGALSDEEFEAAKQEVLNSTGGNSSIETHSTSKNTSEGNPTGDNSNSVKEYNIKDSPFDPSKNWNNVNPNQTHFEACPECGSESVWFGRLKGKRHLKCESCDSEWRKEENEDEKQGLIFSRTDTEVGWREIEGPNKDKFQSKSDWNR